MKTIKILGGKCEIIGPDAETINAVANAITGGLSRGEHPQHTPGAMKAAEIIMGDDEFIFTTFGRKRVEGLAALISNQTHDAELLAALEAAAEALDGHGDESTLPEVLKAIAKAKA